MESTEYFDVVQKLYSDIHNNQKQVQLSKEYFSLCQSGRYRRQTTLSSLRDTLDSLVAQINDVERKLVKIDKLFLKPINKQTNLIENIPPLNNVVDSVSDGKKCIEYDILTNRLSIKDKTINLPTPIKHSVLSSIIEPIEQSYIKCPPNTVQYLNSIGAFKMDEKVQSCSLQELPPVGGSPLILEEDATAARALNSADTIINEDINSSTEGQKIRAGEEVIEGKFPQQSYACSADEKSEETVSEHVSFNENHDGLVNLEETVEDSFYD